ncbi:MAG: hypothetical protein ACI8WP_001482, partial [Flavobacteriaceae bacterium]
AMKIVITPMMVIRVIRYFRMISAILVHMENEGANVTIYSVLLTQLSS